MKCPSMRLQPLDRNPCSARLRLVQVCVSMCTKVELLKWLLVRPRVGSMKVLRIALSAGPGRVLVRVSTLSCWVASLLRWCWKSLPTRPLPELKRQPIVVRPMPVVVAIRCREVLVKLRWVNSLLVVDRTCLPAEKRGRTGWRLAK